MFDVPGRPVPKKRPRTIWKGGKPITYTPSETVRFEKLIGASFANEVPSNWSVGNRYKISITAYIKKTISGNARKIDIDNVAKSVLDALNNKAWNDDSQVDQIVIVRKSVSKEHEERTEIVLSYYQEYSDGFASKT